MLGWFSSKILRWARDYNSRYDECIVATPIRARETADVEGMRFTVMPARGGTIVQMSTYDRVKDRSDTVTHVIPEGEDIAVRVGEIVSMEMLSQ